MEVLVDCLTFRFLSTLSDGVGISSNTLGRADIHVDRLALIDYLTGYWVIVRFITRFERWAVLFLCLNKTKVL